MATIELPRVSAESLRLSTERNSETKSFYESEMPQRAQEKLGYSYAVEQRAAEVETLEKNQHFNGLLNALDKLKIQPLDPYRVQAYQAKMTRGGRRIYWVALPLFIVSLNACLCCLVTGFVPALHRFALEAHTNVVWPGMLILEIASVYF